MTAPTQQLVSVPRTQLVMHPDNSNVMDERTYDRIRQSIRKTGRYVPPLVRSLEASDDFADLHKDGKLQMLDGEHRWQILNDIEEKDPGRIGPNIDVLIWDGITDLVAHLYVASMNHGGADDPDKRMALLGKIHAQIGGTTDELMAMLPDPRTLLARICEPAAEAKSDRVTREDGSLEVGARGGTIKAPDTAVQLSTVAIMATPDDKRAIDDAISKWLDEHDPNREIQQGRQGKALADICGAWLSQGDES